MPLQTQYVQVDVGGGLDQKTDQRLVIPGNFINRENTVYTKVGAVQKRPGNDLLTNDVFGAVPSELPAARSLYGFGDSLLMFGQTSAYALDTDETVWFDRGRVPEASVSGDLITSVPNNLKWLTSATSANGLTLYICTDTLNVYATLVDTNGTVVFANRQVNIAGPATNPRIGVIGNTFYVLYSSGIIIHARTLDATFPSAFTAEVNLIVNLGNGLWDATTLTGSLIIGYHSNTGNIVAVTYNPALTVGVVANTAVPGTTCRLVSIAGSQADDSIWIAWSIFDGVPTYSLNCKNYSADLSTVRTDTSLVSLGAIATMAIRVGIALQNSGADCFILANTPEQIDSGHLRKYYVVGSGAGAPSPSITTQGTIYSQMILATKPFGPINNRYYVGLRNRTERTFYLANVSDVVADSIRPVATFGNYIANGNDDGDGLFGFGASILSDVTVQSVNAALVPGLTNFGETLNVSKFSVTFDEPFSFAEENLALAIATGVPSVFDGNKTTELGFLTTPLCSEPTPATGVGTLVAGIYRYIVVYEWTDAKGQIVRSTPSNIYTFDTTPFAPCAINIRITYCSFTAKQTTATTTDQINVVVYRETPIGTGTYRRWLPVDYEATFPNNVNAVNQHSFTFTDNGSQNAALPTRELIYRSRQLSSDHPPSAKFAVMQGGRLWLAGTDSPTEILASQKVVDGISPNFSNDPRLNFSIPDGGPITGLAALDDKLVVFKKERVYVIFGDGPSPVGTGGDFQVQRISSNTGCIDGQSIVTTATGIMYRAPIGISLLSRGLEVSYIGAQVEDTVNSFTNFSGAISHPNKPWVLFSLGPNPSVSTDGVVLLYDYFVNRWSNWYFHDSSSVADRVYPKSLTVYGDRFAWTTTASNVYKESSQYLDNGEYVNMDIETAWLKFAGLTGFQRVRNLILLGATESAHNLEISLAHNYDTSGYTQTNTFDYNVLQWASEQFGVKVVNQKCSSMKIRIRDLQHADGLGTGRGVTIAGIGLEAGVKGTLFNNLPPQQGG